MSLYAHRYRSIDVGEALELGLVVAAMAAASPSPPPSPPRCVVVWDAESDTGFSAVAGYTRDEKIGTLMQFTVICALEIPSEPILAGAPEEQVLAQSTRHTYWRDVADTAPGSTPVDGLLALFDRAEVIVGYNVLSFDFPLIRRFYAQDHRRYYRHRCKTLDVMQRVRDLTGTFCKLDVLLDLNSLPPKSGKGADAINLWNQGRRFELEEYCNMDVVLTARLALLHALYFSDYLSEIPNRVHGVRAALVAARSESIEVDGFVVV